MQPWVTSPTFSVEKPKTDVFAPAGGWKAEVAPVAPWTIEASQQAPLPILEAYQTDESLKKRYGIELAKASNPFEAACCIFGEETSKALWVSFNWLTDPVTVAARDAYLKTLELSTPPLDREQLAAKVLALSEEKVLNKHGVLIPTIDPKDRIAALKLYSDILGYTGKVEIDNSTKNITNNELTIKLVKPDVPNPVIIENTPNIKSEITNENPLPISLKLVKAG